MVRLPACAFCDEDFGVDDRPVRLRCIDAPGPMHEKCAKEWAREYEAQGGRAKPPERQHMLSIKIQASSFDDILGALHSIEQRLYDRMGEPITDCVSGGLGLSWILEYNENPEQTEGSYQEQLAQYIAERQGDDE